MGAVQGKGALCGDAESYSGERNAEGLRHGKGVLEFGGHRYSGEFTSGKIWGKGSLKYPSGDLYEGDFVEGSRTGHGRMQYAGGDVYEGQWLVDAKHGHGTLTEVDGSSYEGRFGGDKFSGYGVYKTKAGKETYEGEFQDGQRSGVGTLTHNNTTYRGYWEVSNHQSFRSGYGECSEANGETYEGEWKNGTRHGLGHLKSASEEYYGGFSHGVKHGYGVLLSGSAVLEGHFEDGEAVGWGVRTKGNEVYEGMFVGGQTTDGVQSINKRKTLGGADESPQLRSRKRTSVSIKKTSERAHESAVKARQARESVVSTNRKNKKNLEQDLRLLKSIRENPEGEDIKPGQRSESHASITTRQRPRSRSLVQCLTQDAVEPITDFDFANIDRSVSMVASRDEAAAMGWKRIYQRASPEIEIFSRKIRGTPISEMISHVIFPMTAELCFKIHADLDYRKTWDKYQSDITVFDEIGQSRVIYWAAKFPFPMKNRDYIYYNRFKHDPQSGEYRLITRAGEHRDPKAKKRSDYIRVTNYTSEIIFRPHPKGCEVWTVYHEDLKGAIPKSIMSFVMKVGIPDYCKNLTVVAKKYGEYLKNANGIVVVNEKNGEYNGKAAATAANTRRNSRMPSTPGTPGTPASSSGTPDSRRSRRKKSSL